VHAQRNIVLMVWLRIHRELASINAYTVNWFVLCFYAEFHYTAYFIRFWTSVTELNKKIGWLIAYFNKKHVVSQITVNLVVSMLRILSHIE